MLDFSLEIIDYQNNDLFPTELASVVSGIYREIDDGLYEDNRELMHKSRHVGKIVKLVKDRFNMTIEMDKELHAIGMAAVIPALTDDMTRDEIMNRFTPSLILEYFRGGVIFKRMDKVVKEREAFMKKLHGRKGFVDLKNARLGGYLSEAKHYVLLDFFTLKNTVKLSPREVVAVLLHEIGHAFVGLETHHRLVKTNSTMLDILTEIDNNKVDKAYYTYKREFDREDLDKAALGGNKDVVDFNGKLVNTYMYTLDSSIINTKYNETNYENLADSFSTRFGMGGELVSGLDKLHKLYGGTTNSRAVWGTVILIDIAIWSIVFGVMGPVGGALGLATLIAILQLGYHKETMTYDKPLDRYSRIRNSITNNLKDVDLPVSVVKYLLVQLKYIDDAIKNSYEIDAVMKNLADQLNYTYHTDTYYINLQRTVENNLNNDLYIKSTQLRVS